MPQQLLSDGAFALLLQWYFEPNIALTVYILEEQESPIRIERMASKEKKKKKTPL